LAQTLQLRSRMVKRNSTFGFVVMYAVFIACIAWFSFAMIDPNYKWIFVDDNVMRVRNGLFIIVAGYWVVATLRLHRMARGLVPIATLERDGGEVLLAKSSPMPFRRSQVEVLHLPVSVKLTEDRNVSFSRNTFMRSVKFVHAGGKVRVNTVWPWDGVDQESLESFLAQVE